MATHAEFDIERLLAKLDGQPGGIDLQEQPQTIPDFISGYADYADVLEAPRILHEIVAIQLVATALNRNGAVIRLGAVRYSLDLWTLLLSGSGAGRSTTIGMAKPTIEAAHLENLEISVRWVVALLSTRTFQRIHAVFTFGERWRSG